MSTSHEHSLIIPSILSADFTKLGEEVRAVEQAGADMIHFDVMDNHYVPNLTFGASICKAVGSAVKIPLDVHLMASPVDRLIVEFAEAGAEIISIHPEATEHIDRSLSLIRDCDCKAGVVLNPGTPLSCLEWILEKVDIILVMSVNPGFAAQQFILSSLEKIKSIKKIIDDQYKKNGKIIRLEVDGGIKENNIKLVAEAGADAFVIGSEIFKNPDPGEKSTYANIFANLRKELQSIAKTKNSSR
ncbi:MAG: ribulose-phosphate 3-epimerase [Betaproteobacteria bacterium TMED82]|mgnify:CR=1 FL=1|nr:MAG: ribulose-phosphate 3-epimerase [Betaproteobacteria bacterium TMED82]|tara:strand:+ start:20286 stop:21017 length:732 start_codon:yes stop_codon:yes gene_type:complete